MVTLVMINQTNKIMADIRIEKKKPLWPWLLLIIIIAVIVFLYVYGSSDSDKDDMQIEDTEDVTSVNTDLMKSENIKFLIKIENHEHSKEALV